MSYPKMEDGPRAWEDRCPWQRDYLCHNTIWPGQDSCNRGAILEAIDCAQHSGLPKFGLRRLEAFEVAISVTADAIDHMMKGVDQ